ncbi:MAG TPA: YibE/F family protein [Patescibacteria group bacterium]|nr:YibE/F family protein [Patescibacteria group bacterium]
MTRRLFAIFINLFFFFFTFSTISFAQSPEIKEQFYKAEVVEIVSEGIIFVPEGQDVPYQTISVNILDGDKKGEQLTIEHGKLTTLREDQKVRVGEKVVLLQLPTPNGVQYQIIDRYRLDTLLPILFFFFVLVVALSRWKGVGSIVGLVISLSVILFFIVPQILAGRDPLFISIVGSLFIMATTIYFAHGFSRKTHIALLSTTISLTLTGFLAYVFVELAQLTGLGNDDANSLRFGVTETINFQGLLLGGIIIGALGVLDDITTSLSAVIEELKKANPNYSFQRLVTSGFRVGSEHIASLVNTLVLAYAGAGLPLFLFLIVNPLGHPLWVIINSEIIVEEIIRTLAGSIGLVFAVPITTLLASWFVTRKKERA